MRTTRSAWIICLVLPLIFTSTTVFGFDDPQPPASEVILLKKCAITYERATFIGAFSLHGTTSNPVQEIMVKIGDRVKAGQVIGRMFNKELVAELEARVANFTESKVKVLQNEALFELERAKMERLRRINARQALLVSAQDVQIQQIAMKVAQFEVAASVQKSNYANAEMKTTETILASRNLVTPHDGIVVEIFAPEGEVVMNSKPIFRVVDTDQLRVTAFLDARDVWRVKKGHAVRITPEVSGGDDLPIEREVFQGEVQFVDSEIDPQNQTCRVIALVANRGSLLRAGLECQMEINLQDRVQPKASPAKAVGANAPAQPAAAAPTSKVSTERHSSR